MRWRLRRRDRAVPSHRAVREEAQRIVAGMPLPCPFTLAGLVGNVAAERGREIHLVPVPDRLLGGSSLCGLWLKQEELGLDLIFYPHSTSKWHQEKIILHELAHLWCDDADGVTQQEMAELLGDFPPALIGMLVGRGQAAARRRYGTHTEARAETVADVIQQRAYAQSAQESGDAVLRALSDSLTYPNRTSP
ncbi:hypothetical protein [Streptomyces sp. NPDC048603]|uniref:hypothetical protein n=1 Tax=Streptomyces sp. NPDC048603 TaxID=3365577 RepID=UPI003723FA8D